MLATTEQHKLKSNYERQNFICDADDWKWNARKCSQTKWDVSLIKHNKLDILIKIMASSLLSLSALYPAPLLGGLHV